MSFVEEEESPDPKFWLEFRTFDDGMNPLRNNPTLTHARTTFPQFALLPPELRFQVWEYLVQPRVVVACGLHRDDPSLDDRRRELDRRTTRGRVVPVLLHINRQARAVGLRHYELAFSWRISRLVSDTPTSGPARVFFNFAQDALLLTGELEAYDTYGFNLTMVYFMRREDTFRVRYVACAFRELGYPEQDSDQVFGCLWHVVDRFPGVERLLLTVGEGDEERLGDGGGGRITSTDNVMQKVWNGWMCWTTVTGSRMADKQMLLVREDDLMGYVARQTP